jgi:triacylglycerol lipase
MIQEMNFLEKAYLFATLSNAAYTDDCSKNFLELGMKPYNYVLFSNQGAFGHAACNKSDLILTFRGTNPKSLNDIYADLDTIPKRHANGWVHEGFRREARKLLPMVINYIRHYPNRKIWLTGHSLGAAMALYITQELEFAGYAPKMLFTYGCPRLGNKEYVDCIKTKHHRFVNCNDIVPTVPPSLIGFCHHGILHYINYYGNIRQLTSWQKFKDKMRAHYYAFKKGELFEGIDDHSISLYATRIKDIDPNK